MGNELRRDGGPIAVVGATGYIGGRLVGLLLERGWRVRACARNTEKLSCRPFAGHPMLEAVRADVMDQASLEGALQGAQAAFYLVHSMPTRSGEKGADFASADRRAAARMAGAAAAAGVRRVIYLGGLGDEDDPDLSHHLKSRLETGRVLADGPVPVTILRAAMILGSGSASFEIMRYLVDRLPVMVTPRWVRTQAQPIAVTDVLAYLAGCLEHPETTGQTYDIGGPDVMDYEGIFAIYAQEAGLPQRMVVPVPVLTPRLSSWWIHLVTPVPASLARPLAEGLRNRVVCGDNRIRDIIPTELLTVRRAIRRALDRIGQDAVPTCWSDAGEARPPEWLTCGDAPYAGGTVLESSHRVDLDCPPEAVWPVVARIGGDNGWYFADPLWRLRGLADRLLGGVGLRRGRRHPTQIGVGDALDFWRVLAVEPGKRLLLLAEMKLPGQAVLQFSLEPLGAGCRLSQVARFLPRGVLGLAYWWAMAPFHAWLFPGMLRGMLRAVAGDTGCRVLSGPESFKDQGASCSLRPPSGDGGSA